MRPFLIWFLASFFALVYPQAASADSAGETLTLATAAPDPAMTAFGRFDACLFLEELHRLKYPRYKWAFYTLATLIGLSRIYLESHWPSNILAGAVTGIYCGQRVLGREVTILNWRF